MERSVIVDLDQDQLRRKIELQWRVVAAVAGIGIGVLVAIPAMVLAVQSAGLGHRDPVLARALFPIPMLLANVPFLLIGLGLLQYPFFGWVVARAIIFRKWRLALLTFTAHTLALVAVFSWF